MVLKQGQQKNIQFNKYVQQTQYVFSRIEDQQKNNFQFKAEKQIGDYLSGKLIRQDFKYITRQEVLQYFVEKQITFVQGAIQIQSSLLYKVLPGETFSKVLFSVRKNKNLRPDVIKLYLLSTSLQALMDYTQTDGESVKNHFIQEFAQYLKFSNSRNIQHFGNIGASVKGLTKNILKSINLDDFCWTYKIDGQRAFLVISVEDDKYPTGQADQAKQYVLKQDFQQTFDLQKKYTILDTEEYDDKFYIFDILHDKGKDVMSLPYAQRLEILKKIDLPKNCVLKHFYPIQEPNDLRHFVKSSVGGIAIDGIVLSNMTKTYIQTESYKLKDKKYLTNDYLLKYISLPTRTQKQLTNFQHDDVMYQIYVGSRPENFKFVNDGNPSQKSYQEMLFSLPYFKTMPTEYMVLNKQTLEKAKLYSDLTEVEETIKLGLKHQLDDMIVECAFDENMRPYPIRIRKDKTHTYKNEKTLFGNDFNTARTNLENAMDPITPEYLRLPVDEQYFNKQEVDKSYDEYRQFGRKCRQNCFYHLLDKVHGTKHALDIGAGRNATYYLFFKKGFETVIAYEPDVQANITYYSRMMDFLRYEKNKMPLTYIVNQYCSSSVREQLSFNKINFFTCDYAFHYLCDSESTILDIKNFILSFADKTAYFQILDYDGQAVFNLLKTKTERTFDNGKYFISTKDQSKQLKPFGQKYNILLPTIHTTMTEEYFLNIEAIKKIFEPEIKLIEKRKMAEVIDMKIQKEDKDILNLIYQYVFEIKN